MRNSIEPRSTRKAFTKRAGRRTLVAVVGGSAIVACNLFAGEDFTSSAGGADASSPAGTAAAAGHGNGGANGTTGGATALGGSSGRAGEPGLPALGGSVGMAGARATGGSGTGGREQNQTGGTASGGAAPIAGRGGSHAVGSGGVAAGGQSNPTGGVNTGGAMGGNAGTSGASGGAGAAGGAANTTGGVATCGGEVLRNGDFENGSTAWTATSNWPGAEQVVVSADNAVLKSEGVEPYSGNSLAWLGGVPDSSSSHRITLTQSIELPATTTGLTLTGYSLIHTEEPDLGNTFDSAYIEIILATSEDDETVLFVTDPFFTPSNASAAWVPLQRAIETTEWKQSKLLFRITSNSDDGKKTHFWFDKLSLIATCGR